MKTDLVAMKPDPVAMKPDLVAMKTDLVAMKPDPAAMNTDLVAIVASRDFCGAGAELIDGKERRRAQKQSFSLSEHLRSLTEHLRNLSKNPVENPGAATFLSPTRRLQTKPITFAGITRLGSCPDQGSRESLGPIMSRSWAGHGQVMGSTGCRPVWQGRWPCEPQSAEPTATRRGVGRHCAQRNHTPDDYGQSNVYLASAVTGPLRREHSPVMGEWITTGL